MLCMPSVMLTVEGRRTLRERRTTKLYVLYSLHVGPRAICCVHACNPVVSDSVTIHEIV